MLTCGHRTTDPARSAPRPEARHLGASGKSGKSDSDTGSLPGRHTGVARASPTRQARLSPTFQRFPPVCGNRRGLPSTLRRYEARAIAANDEAVTTISLERTMGACRLANERESRALRGNGTQLRDVPQSASCDMALVGPTGNGGHPSRFGTSSPPGRRCDRARPQIRSRCDNAHRRRTDARGCRLPAGRSACAAARPCSASGTRCMPR